VFEISDPIEVKIIVVGSLKSGKSSLVRRMVGDGFSLNYTPTRGCDVYEMITVLKCTGRRFHVFIWDTSGIEAYAELTRSYLKGAAAAIITCPLEGELGEESVKQSVNNIRSECGPIPILVARTISDQRTRGTNTDRRSLNDSVPSIDVSARDGYNVQYLLDSLLLEITRHHQLIGTRVDIPIPELTNLMRQST